MTLWIHRKKYNILILCRMVSTDNLTWNLKLLAYLPDFEHWKWFLNFTISNYVLKQNSFLNIPATECTFFGNWLILTEHCISCERQSKSRKVAVNVDVGSALLYSTGILIVETMTGETGVAIILQLLPTTNDWKNNNG